MIGYPGNRASGELGTRGCVIGCLAALVLVPLFIIVCGYFVVMHSSVPLRLMGAAMNAADGITIKGVGGSISSGFTIDELRMSDDDGNESVMEGLALKWQDMTKLKTSRQLIIEEIALERAHFFIDTSEIDDASEDESGVEPDVAEDDGDVAESTELKLFEIRKVDVREVVFESTTGDFKLELDEFMMKGLRIEGDEFALEDLSMGSNFVDFQLEDAKPAQIGDETVPFTRLVRGVVKPTIHESILKDVDFTLELGAIDGDLVTRIRLLGGAVEFVDLGEGREQSMTVRHLTAADYFTSDWGVLPDDFSLNARRGEAPEKSLVETTEIEGGEFTIGQARFTIAPQVVQTEGPEGGETEPIVATGDHAGLVVTAYLENLETPPFIHVRLQSKPQREPRELMALLLFEKPFGELTPADAAEVEKAVERTRSKASQEP